MYRELPLGFLRISDGKRITHRDPEWPEVQAWIAAGGQPEPQPMRPSEFHDWNGTAWVENLDRARAFVRARWNQHRDTQLEAGVAFGGWTAHADDRFMGELQLLITAIDKGVLSGPQAIRGKDNQTRMLEKAEIEALALAAGAHRQAVYAASWSAKDQLAGKATVADVLALLPPA